MGSALALGLQPLDKTVNARLVNSCPSSPE
jgi:hypothetical protein